MYYITKTYKIRFFLFLAAIWFAAWSQLIVHTFSFIIPSSHIMKNITEWNEISKQLFFSQIWLEGGGVVG